MARLSFLPTYGSSVFFAYIYVGKKGRLAIYQRSVTMFYILIHTYASNFPVAPRPYTSNKLTYVHSLLHDSMYYPADKSGHNYSHPTRTGPSKQTPETQNNCMHIITIF